MFDDRSSGDRRDSGCVDAKMGRHDLGRTEVDANVISETLETAVEPRSVNVS
jgi:hypothetical protein